MLASAQQLLLSTGDSLMHLSNFTLTTDVSAHGHLITLNAHGLEWDLHNHADFEGFDYSTTITSSSLTLKWRIGERIREWRDAGGQYGVPNYPCNRFCIVFTNVGCLEIAPRDGKMPKGEDLGISYVSFIEAGENLEGYKHYELIPCYDPSKETLPYHLIFRFNGGQIIRVGAEKADFVLLD